MGATTWMTPETLTAIAGAACLFPAVLAAAVVLWFWPRRVRGHFRIPGRITWYPSPLPLIAFAAAVVAGAVVWAALLWVLAWETGWFACR